MASKWMGLVIAAFGVALPAIADGRDQARVEGPEPLMPAECHDRHSVLGDCDIRRESSHIVRRPAVTRIVTHAPPTTVRRVVQSSSATTQGIDFSGFNGGVDAGVSGGVIVSGGNVFITRVEGQRFSGVRSSAVGRAVLSGRLGGSSY